MGMQQVRDAFRDKLIADFPAGQFIETIAEDPDEEVFPDLWMTVEFSTEGERRVSIGNPSLWMEMGSCYVSVAGKSGLGDAVVMARADLVADKFRTWQYPSEGLIVNDVAEPTQPTGDSNGNWWFCAVQVNYQRTFYK